MARDYAGLILGNAFRERFESIWDGERYQQFRSDFESATAPDPCRGCGLLLEHLSGASTGASTSSPLSTVAVAIMAKAPRARRGEDAALPSARRG